MSKRTARVAYDARKRSSKHAVKLHWHRGSGDTLFAKHGGVLYSIGRRKPDRRHNIFPFVLTYGVKDTPAVELSANGFDTQTDAKRAALIHARTSGVREALPAGNFSSPELAPYVAAVRESLRKMGSDPDDVREASALVERCARGGTEPNVCAAIISATVSHEHPHDCPGKHVEMNEASEANERVSWSGHGDDLHAMNRAGDIYRVRHRVGWIVSINGEDLAHEPFAHQEQAIRFANRRITRDNLSAYGERAGRQTLEANDSTCQPFTRVVRDPAKLTACMARASKPLENSRMIYDLVRADVERQDQEHFYVICLDFRGAVRDYVEVAVGQRHRVAVDVEDILTPILLSRCDGAVVIHNHPSGVAEPSDADCELTENIRKAMAIACPNVRLCDHLVCGSKSFYSFADHPPKKKANGAWEIGPVTKV